MTHLPARWDTRGLSGVDLLVAELRKYVHVRTLFRDDGEEADEVEALVTRAADEIGRLLTDIHMFESSEAYRVLERQIDQLRKGLGTHGERILVALDNCMHEYGKEPTREAAAEWVRTTLHTTKNESPVGFESGQEDRP